MKSVCVIGGGIAGLSAAVFLAEENFNVTLFEKRQSLGGRLCSYFDRTLNCYFDNGQHLLIGAYDSTFLFLDIIGAKENFKFQSRLRIPFLLPNGNETLFQLPKQNNKLSAALSFLNLKTLSILDRFKIISMLYKLQRIDSDEYLEKSVVDFLTENNQSKVSQERFWNIIAISTLNCSPCDASAKMFIDVLKVIFLTGTQKSILVIPKIDLSNSYVTRCIEYFNKKKCTINIGEGIEKINLSENSISSILTSQKRKLEYDYYILAVDWENCDEILTQSYGSNHKFNLRRSPILSVHLWTDRSFMKEEFYSLVGSPIQWVFRKNGFVSIVVSNPGKLIELSKEEIVELCDQELKKYFRCYGNARIVDFRIVKEKKATFIPDANSFRIRPTQETNIKNLFLSGDWTMTSLPSTIESAALSSKKCAEIICNREKAI